MAFRIFTTTSVANLKPQPLIAYIRSPLEAKKTTPFAER